MSKPGRVQSCRPTPEITRPLLRLLSSIMLIFAKPQRSTEAGDDALMLGAPCSSIETATFRGRLRVRIVGGSCKTRCDMLFSSVRAIELCRSASSAMLIVKVTAAVGVTAEMQADNTITE